MTTLAQRKPRTLKGFRDFLPDQMILRQSISGRFQEVFERHGFEPLDTPSVEYLEVLTGNTGENEKLMYRFVDHGGRDVGLRYDLTVPLARVVAQHQHELGLPFKRYHIGPVWRAENTQRGRYREFWQCDADIAGTASMVADAELIAMFAEALAAVGLPEFVVHISHRRLLEAIGRASNIPEDQAATLYRTIDKLDKIGPARVVEELAETGIDPVAAQTVMDLVASTGTPSDLLDMLRNRLKSDERAAVAIEELAEIFALLPSFGVDQDRYRLDLSLARGLDYYTGPVYEARVVSPKVGSVGGAGRYDNLIGSFLGRPVPATGMSLGLERIIEVVMEHRLLSVPRSNTDVFVAYFAETTDQAIRVADQLRLHRLNVDLSLLSRRGIGDQLKYADRKGIPLAVIVGTEEMGRGEVSVKHLESGNQSSHDVGLVGEVVASMVASTASGLPG